MSATANGKPRRQLSDQLDRMDSIIDALADGLPGAVADACREGARAAIKDALLEVLASPELRALLARPAPETPPPTPAPEPGPWARLKARLGEWRRRACEAMRPAAARVAERCRAAAPTLTAVGGALGWVWHLRTQVLAAAGVGLAVAAVSYLAPHTVSAAISGLGGLCAALAVQGAIWVRNTAQKFGLM